MSQSIVIDKDGTVRFIYSDELAAIAGGVGTMDTKRASHVEPDGETWTADLTPSGGPVRKGFKTRAEALQFEVDWLKKNWLGIE